MIFSMNFPMICISIGLHALCYNFSSGSGDALAYDSLLLDKRQDEYARYESNQLIIYRICEGLSTMCAGLALLIGYKLAYASSLVTCTIQIIILLSLSEVGGNEERKNSNLFGSIKKELIKKILTIAKESKKRKDAEAEFEKFKQACKDAGIEFNFDAFNAALKGTALGDVVLPKNFYGCERTNDTNLAIKVTKKANGTKYNATKTTQYRVNENGTKRNTNQAYIPYNTIDRKI